MLNNLTIMGRLTADPEVRLTKSDVKVCNFSIAVQRPKRKDSEPEVDFFHCVAWRGTADIIEKYFGKGNLIAIQGRLRNNAYLKNDEKRIITQIIVEQVFFTGEHRKEKEDSKSEIQTYDNSSLEIFDEESDDILSDDGVPF